jgi:hypothetical protein
MLAKHWISVQVASLSSQQVAWLGDECSSTSEMFFYPARGQAGLFSRTM